MITGYVKPQLIIRQLLERVPDIPQTVLNTFVLGPRYALHRYTNADEREAMDGVTFLHNTSDQDEDRQLVPYEDLEDTGVIDEAYAKVYGENLEASLVAYPSDASDGYVFKIKDEDPNKIELREISGSVVGAAVNLGAAGDDLWTALNGRPLQAGDIIYLTNDDDGTTVRRQIIDIEKAASGSSFGTNASKDDNLALGAATNVADTVAAFTSVSVPADFGALTAVTGADFFIAGTTTGQAQGTAYGDTYTITCTSGGAFADALFRIRSASGKVSADNIKAVYDSVGDLLYFAHPSLGGIVVSTDTSSVGSGEVLTGAKFEFTVRGDFAALDLSNGTETTRDFSVELTGSEYNGTKDTTYVLTVKQGTSAAKFAPIKITAVTDDDEATCAADADEDTGTYYARGFIPGFWFDPAVAFQRDASGNLTAVAAADGTSIAGTGPFDSTFVGKTLYLIENPDGTNYATDHPYATNHSYAAGAVIQISDTNGVDISGDVTLTADGSGVENNFALGSNGLIAVFRDQVFGITQYGLRKGDVFYVHAKASANDGVSSTLVLSGRSADTSDWDSATFTATSFDIDARVLYTGEVDVHSNIAGDQYEAGEAADGGIFIRNTLLVYVPSFPDAADQWREVLGVVSANGVDDLYFPSKLFAHYRAFIPAASGEEIQLYSVVPEDALKVDIDNPFAYGLSRALSGAQGRPVYAAPVPSDDVAGYNTILRQALNIEGIYAIAPMTNDVAIQLAVRDHCNAASTETKKLWRRAYVATESPGEYSKVSVDTDGNNTLAQVTTHANGNVRVVSANGNFLANGVSSGDLFRTNYGTDLWGDETYDEYVIATVLDDTELLLSSGPDLPITPASKFEIWAPDEAQDQADFVAARSKQFGSRRVCNVWCENPTVVTIDGEIRTCPVMYAAAEIAGIRSALFPQQGLTRTEIRTFSTASAMYTRYTDDELDTAAANGTLVITQDKPGGTIFIRHQLTTDANNGLLYYEDSIGANLDEISYAIKDELISYIGKRNATPEVVQEIRTRIRGILQARKAAPPGQDLVGPAIIDYADLFVQIDADNADTINVGVTLTMSTPLNVVDVTLNATAFSGETSVSVTIAA